jgi:predicted Zn-dependent protease
MAMTSACLRAEPIALPDIGDSAGALISPEQERKIGEAFLREARQYGVVFDDPEVDAYFQSLGQQVASFAKDYEGSFTFFLVDADDINAFAAPGGFIGAHTGLLLNSASESELASVLAHEISHVTQRHMVRSYEAASKMSLPMAAAMLGAILVGVANPDAAQAAIAAVAAGQQQYMINFTRGNEQEADRVGIQLLHDAGYDAHAMPSFFERLQTANRYSDPKSIPEFLRTHPVTVNRISEARERAEAMSPVKHADSNAYRLMRARVKVLTADDPKALVEELEAELRTGAFERANVTRYAYALALTRVHEFEKARLQLAQLRRAEPSETTYLLALAELELEAGDLVASLERYDETLRLYPGYRPAQLGYIAALLRSGHVQRARTTLRDYSYEHNPDPRYYKLLAEAEELAGAPIESHIAMAEYHFRMGEIELALQQLEIANRAPTIDYYQRERVLARMDEMKENLESLEQRHRRDQFRGRSGLSTRAPPPV